MNINPGKADFTEGEHDSLRKEIHAAIKAGVAQAEIARASDVPSSTLSQYLSGTYNSEPGKTTTAGKLTKWLRALELDAELRRRLPVAPNFISLRGSKSITAALGFARETGRIIQVTGSPGVSKTATARQFREDYPRTWYAAMDPTTGGVQTMLLEVLAAMGTTDVKGTPQALMRMVVQKASDAKGLIIIDESQHLSDQAVDALRAVNDKIKIGIALLGNEIAHARVGGTGVKAAFAQVSSRIAMRNWIAAPDPRDAADLANAWADANGEVITPKELAFCQQIAAKPGGLRNIEMTMEAALLAARGAGQPLFLDHLQGAFSQLQGLNHHR